MGSWDLGAAGLAGSFLGGGVPLPFAGGAWGVPPGLEPLVGGPQKQAPWAQGRGDALLAPHLQLVVESLKEATSKSITLDSVKITNSNVSVALLGIDHCMHDRM